MVRLKDGSNAGLRPPYLTTFHATDEPLIVLPVFLSRADSTAQRDRPRDSENVVDNNGNPIPEPADDPSALAFESDPNLAYEKWDEYWRKVHGMRFTFEEGPQDRSMSVLLRYDQVHRLPGGPTSAFPPPYHAPLDENGQLHTGVIGRIAPYKRPLYDGLAYMAFRSVEDLTLSFGSGKFPSKIVPEEQVMFRSVPHMISREFILIASATHRDPISLVKTHTRAPDIGRNDFQGRWLQEHAEFVIGTAATHQYVRRYAQLHNIGPKEGELFWHPISSKWDGLSIFSFAGVTDLEDFLMSDDYAAIEADEARIVDATGSEYWTGVNYNMINRLYPERVTRR